MSGGRGEQSEHPPVRVKVCGVTTTASAATLVGQADFVGLNFWPKSRRYVTAEQAAALVESLPSGIAVVGLFVDADPEAVETIVDRVPLDLLQFHGDETPDYCRRFDRPFMKAFRLRDEQTVETIGPYLDGPDSHFLVDAFVPGQVGGSGHPVRLDLARRARERWDARMFLAGGLTPETVAAAIEAVEPWAVDVASGVEAAPGIKDSARVRAFAAAARRSPA